MIQIEKRMLSAILARKDYSCDNTRLRFDGNDWTLTLHQTDIAKRIGGIIVLKTDGYRTTTTKSRLNAILSHFGKGGISQEKGVWYWYYSGRGERVAFVDGMQFDVTFCKE